MTQPNWTDPSATMRSYVPRRLAEPHIAAAGAAVSPFVAKAPLAEQTAVSSPTWDRILELLNDLRLATDEAAAWDFDLPSAEATDRAENFLRAIILHTHVGNRTDVAVGEDGSIELTITQGSSLIVLDIPPSGSRTSMVIQDHETGEITSSFATVSENDVVRRIEQAI